MDRLLRRRVALLVAPLLLLVLVVQERVSPPEGIVSLVRLAMFPALALSYVSVVIAAGLFLALILRRGAGAGMPALLVLVPAVGVVAAAIALGPALWPFDMREMRSENREAAAVEHYLDNVERPREGFPADHVVEKFKAAGIRVLVARTIFPASAWFASADDRLNLVVIVTPDLGAAEEARARAGELPQISCGNSSQRGFVTLVEMNVVAVVMGHGDCGLPPAEEVARVESALAALTQ